MEINQANIKRRNFIVIGVIKHSSSNMEDEKISKVNLHN